VRLLSTTRALFLDKATVSGDRSARYMEANWQIEKSNDNYNLVEIKHKLTYEIAKKA